MPGEVCQGCDYHCPMDHRRCDKPLEVAHEVCNGCACHCYMNRRMCDGRGMGDDPAMVSFEKRPEKKTAK